MIRNRLIMKSKMRKSYENKGSKQTGVMRKRKSKCNVSKNVTTPDWE